MDAPRALFVLVASFSRIKEKGWLIIEWSEAQGKKDRGEKIFMFDTLSKAILYFKEENCLKAQWPNSNSKSSLEDKNSTECNCLTICKKISKYVRNPGNPPLSPFFKGGNLISFICINEKALLSLKKGGREGFLEKPSQIDKQLQRNKFLFYS